MENTKNMRIAMTNQTVLRGSAPDSAAFETGSEVSRAAILREYQRQAGTRETIAKTARTANFATHVCSRTNSAARSGRAAKPVEPPT